MAFSIAIDNEIVEVEDRCNIASSDVALQLSRGKLNLYKEMQSTTS
ncbi:MAG: hypothetical protein WC996_03300 [Peptostreptococcales bacterium]